MIDTPVTICFAITQNQTILQVNYITKSCDDFNAALETVREQQCVFVIVTWCDFDQSRAYILRWSITKILLLLFLDVSKYDFSSFGSSNVVFVLSYIYFSLLLSICAWNKNIAWHDWLINKSIHRPKVKNRCRRPRQCLTHVFYLSFNFLGGILANVGISPLMLELVSYMYITAADSLFLLTISRWAPVKTRVFRNKIQSGS